MVPTILPAGEMVNFAPVRVDIPELKLHLEELGLMKHLQASQLKDQELSIVVRALARRGYAELDSRRCDCAVRWVVFMGGHDGTLTICSETQDGRLHKASWPAKPVAPPTAS